MMLFFILSGFLMSYIYMNEQFNKTNVYNFGVARVARVLPLFTVVVLASYFLHMVGVDSILYSITDLNSLLSHLFLLSGTSVLWTIHPEIQFYVLFVFLWFLYSKRALYLYISASAVFFGFVFLKFPNLSWKVFGLDADGIILLVLPFFLVGVVFGQLYRNWKVPQHVQNNLFILSLFLLLLIYPRILRALTGYDISNEIWSATWILLAVSAIYFSLVFLVPESNALLCNRVGDFLGKISYSLYLLHLPVLEFFRDSARNDPLTFLFVFILVSVVTAALSYFLIEHPTRAAIRSMGIRNWGFRV